MCSHKAIIAVFISSSKSFLLTEAELTTFANVGLDDVLVAVKKAVQLLDQDGKIHQVKGLGEIEVEEVY